MAPRFLYPFHQACRSPARACALHTPFRFSFLPFLFSFLPSLYFSRYGLERVAEEKYNVHGRIFYQYTVEGGTLGRAVRLRKEIASRGIEDAWVVGYRGRKRVIPGGEVRVD